MLRQAFPGARLRAPALGPGVVSTGGVLNTGGVLSTGGGVSTGGDGADNASVEARPAYGVGSGVGLGLANPSPNPYP